MRPHAKTLALVAERPDRLPPPAVLKVPRHGLAHAALECLTWLPAQFTANLRSIHRITTVVVWPIGDKGYQGFIRFVGRHWRHLVQKSTDRRDDMKVRSLRIATDIIAFAHACFGQHGEQSADMVVDIKPVAHILAFAINGN